ncbi:carboxymuconolactone decarboxylase family protein [Acidovorax sp. NCPPB 2350]|nr:carboxymuconolactone decarboxylase family protein [Acidovorax sp. NCPPB 2350]
MPRISLPSPEKMLPEQRSVYDKVVAGRRGKVQGPLRAALHNAELADRWQALGELLRYDTTLTSRQSELAILVTGRACGSPFEWHAHRSEAHKAGIPPEVIDALLVEAMPTGLPLHETVVVAYARELNATNSVSDVTHARALEFLGERALVELTALVGYYTMVAMMLNAQEIPLPEGEAPAFPWPQEAVL